MNITLEEFSKTITEDTMDNNIRSLLQVIHNIYNYSTTFYEFIKKLSMTTISILYEVFKVLKFSVEILINLLTKLATTAKPIIKKCIDLSARMIDYINQKGPDAILKSINLTLQGIDAPLFAVAFTVSYLQHLFKFTADSMFDYTKKLQEYATKYEKDTIHQLNSKLVTGLLKSLITLLPYVLVVMPVGLGILSRAFEGLFLVVNVIIKGLSYILKYLILWTTTRDATPLKQLGHF
jgi:hypothetical protein